MQLFIIVETLIMKCYTKKYNEDCEENCSWNIKRKGLHCPWKFQAESFPQKQLKITRQLNNVPLFTLYTYITLKLSCNMPHIHMYVGGKFLKKLLCCVSGKSIAGSFGIIIWVDNMNWPLLKVWKLMFQALALCHIANS